MSARLLTLMILIAVFAAILELVRREKLTFRYAFAWLLVVLAGIGVALADRLFERIATALGFTLLSNFLFFSFGVAAVFLGLVMTVFLCQQSQRNELMAKKIALLEEKINNRK